VATKASSRPSYKRVVVANNVSVVVLFSVLHITVSGVTSSRLYAALGADGAALETDGTALGATVQLLELTVLALGADGAAPWTDLCCPWS